MRLRTRLVGAFVALLAGAVALSSLGWFLMQRTRTELQGYEDQVLPQIASALDLAERISRLAATAPQLAASPTPEVLEAYARVARELVQDIRQRSGGLQAQLEPFIALGDGELLRLARLTLERQQVHRRMQAQIERLHAVGAALQADGATGSTRLQLWSALVLGATADTPSTLGRLEADAEALRLALYARGEGASSPAVIELLALADGPTGLLAQRRLQRELDERSNAVVTLTRSNADRLTALVADHVDALRSTTRERSAGVRGALGAGQAGLLLLTLACLAVAATAALFVHQIVGQIERITRVMTRLADGDAGVARRATPALRRRDEIGALARAFEVFRENLLARQRLLADVRRQSTLLGTVHDSLNDGLAVFDRGGRLRLWNPVLDGLLCRMAPGSTPLQRGERMAALLARLPAGSGWRAPGDAATRPLADGDPPPFLQQPHIELHLPGPRVLDVRSRAMPGGGVVSLVTDLSERRATEAQLQQAMRLDMLGRLTGGVAHDFHNHLGTIVASLALLEAQGSPGDAGHAARSRALQAADRAVALTRRLLAFARRQPLQAEWVAVDSMVEEMADLIEYSAGTGVALRLALHSGDQPLLIDRGQLENALLNLVINSAAAMPGGGVLTVATACEGGELLLRVADTGCGIDEALLPRVVEPFFSTKRPLAADGSAGAAAGTEGSGLGLSIVYGFVRQSGGRLRIDSRVDQGTEVLMAFPLPQPLPHAIASNVSSALQADEIRPATGAPLMQAR